MAHAPSGLPEDALFANREWRISPTPFPIDKKLLKDLEFLGRVLHKFYQATNLLYRRSAEGKAPSWSARWLDQGKPDSLINAQRHPALKNDIPASSARMFSSLKTASASRNSTVSPGGIGLTGALGQVYDSIGENTDIVGGANGMIDGFDSIFGDAPEVHLIVSEESATYRPEMEWLAAEIDEDRFQVHDSTFSDFREGDSVYRFFELFDLANVECSKDLIAAALKKDVQLTPPPKPILEEKMLFALLWNRNLRDYWHRELGEAFSTAC